MKLGKREIGPGHPCYIIAEIGINHNGELHHAMKLMDVAKEAGCDAVKFQKRTPEICVPDDQKTIPRETPWGVMAYLRYKERMEFGQEEYDQIDRYAGALEIDWFASVWDEEAALFMNHYPVPAHKVASASLTDYKLLRRLVYLGRPVLLSTGMSTPEEVGEALKVLKPIQDNVGLLHCTSTYPMKNGEANLRVMDWLQSLFPGPVGYSGHESGLQISIAAVAMGASILERHITLDRTMWGTDQAASLEPEGLKKLVRDVRIVEEAMGDGVKRVWDSELPSRKKLRG